MELEKASQMMRKLIALIVFVSAPHSAPATASERTAHDAARFNIDMRKDFPMAHRERAFARIYLSRARPLDHPCMRRPR